MADTPKRTAGKRSRKQKHVGPHKAAPITAGDLARARETWKRDAPPAMRNLLDARKLK